MLMFAVAFVAGAEMTSRSDLLTSAADLAAATTERVIGAASSGFWSAMPQATQEITVEVGTKLVFKWSGGHDLVITGKDVWDTCVSTGLLNRLLAVHTPTVAPTKLGLCRGSCGERTHTRANCSRSATHPEPRALALDRASLGALTTSALPLNPTQARPVTAATN